MRGTGAAVAGLVALAACSGATAVEGGVVTLELRLPRADSVRLTQSLQLAAVARDAQGDSVAAEVTWATPDTTLTVSPGGLVTGRRLGTGRVQARAGTLVSDFISFRVVP